MNEIRNVEVARRKGVQENAMNDRLRCVKKTRMRPRRMCCVCKKRSAVKSDGSCVCGHGDCVVCLCVEQELKGLEERTANSKHERM